MSSDISYKNAGRCKMCKQMFLTKKEARNCEAMHRKQKETNIKNEMIDSASENEDQDDEEEYCDMVEEEFVEEDYSPSKRSKRSPRKSVMWNVHSSRLLLELIKENHNDIKAGKGPDRKRIWDDILDRMQGLIPGLTESQMKSKWKGMRNKYLHFMSKTDRDESNYPEHYDILDSFLSESVEMFCNKERIKFEKDDENERPNKPIKRKSNPKLASVYSLLCKEIEDNKLLDDKDSKKTKHENDTPRSEQLLSEVLMEIQVMKTRSFRFQQFVQDSLEEMLVRDRDREKRELAREKRDIAREKREIAREKRELAREKQEALREKKEKAKSRREIDLIPNDENHDEDGELAL